MPVAHPSGVTKVFQIVAVQQATDTIPQPVFRERRILFIRTPHVKRKSRTATTRTLAIKPLVTI